MRQLLSVQVGLARKVQIQGRSILTAIHKNPVDGPTPVTPLGLLGDEQADPSVHGGLDKAVYAYPSEHYGFWQEARRAAGVSGFDDSLPFGSMGENLTLAGVTEADLWVGDVLRFPHCALAVAGREEAQRRLATHARRIGEPAPSVTFLIGAGRAGFAQCCGHFAIGHGLARRDATGQFVYAGVEGRHGVEGQGHVTQIVVCPLQQGRYARSPRCHRGWHRAFGQLWKPPLHTGARLGLARVLGQLHAHQQRPLPGHATVADGRGGPGRTPGWAPVPRGGGGRGWKNL